MAAVKITRMINGFPTSVMVNLGVTIWESTILITNEIGESGTGWDSAHTTITLPGGTTFDGSSKELEVFIGDNYDGGVRLAPGVDWSSGSGSAETTITLAKALPKNSRIGFRKTT